MMQLFFSYACRACVIDFKSFLIKSFLICFFLLFLISQTNDWTRKKHTQLTHERKRDLNSMMQQLSE